MAITDFFKGIFGTATKQLRYFRLTDGGSPMFSQFGQNIYNSDIVLMCIDKIAQEISKLTPRHIYNAASGGQQIPKTSINRLFKFGPNDLMTTKEFLEKSIWLLYKNYNLFIYPTYESKTDASGYTSRYYSGFYPLNPTRVDFLQDPTGVLYAKLYDATGSNFTVPYTDLIHIRKMFSFNDIMGGGADGQPSNAAILKVLEVNNTVMEGLPQAIKSSLMIRGIMKINTMLDNDKLKAERDRFEALLQGGKAAIGTIDLKNEYTPLSIDPKLIDEKTLAFLRDKIINYYGVPLPILTGDYTDSQYQAYYESTLEPIIIALGQAFTKALFTPREQDVGNEIMFYQTNLNYLSIKSKIDLLKIMGDQGLLKDDQKLALFGYPPLDDGTGDRRTRSLNYIDVTLADQYQLDRAKAPQITAQGGGAGE